MKLGSYYLLAFLIPLSISCGTVSIKSTPPEAEVGIVLADQEKPKSLGKTPLTMDLSDIEDAVNTGTIVVVVKKRGYVPQHFVIPNLSGGELDINAILSPNLPSNFQAINRIVTLTLRAEREIIQKRFDDAIKTAAEIKKINENVSSAYEIEGTVFFLQKKMKKSRFAWIRALELEPNNPEGQKILASIEKSLGVSSGLTRKTKK